MSTKKSDVHVAMFPWSAFGHMLPYFHLAIALANHGVRVSYMSTPRNIARLPKIPSNLASLLQYVTLPMPMPMPMPMPEGAEATIDVEIDDIPLLKRAYDLLYEPVKKFVSTHFPTWIISDFAAYWMPKIAEECRVQLMHFAILNASTMCFITTPESLPVAVRDYEATQTHCEVHSSNASGITDLDRVITTLNGCEAICIRSCREFEGDKIDLFQTLINKPVVPVGVLPPAKHVNQGNNDEVFKWLDRQNQGSVIYVAFGSEHKLTKHQVYEIAYGLELAKLPFIWGLRKPTWAVDDTEAVPPDFKNRISDTDRGIVCIGWVPQLDILAHPSVGGSLFHSGWGSIIETLRHGHTSILLPFIHDQGINARVMVQKGLGLEVERGEDGSFSRDDIARALRRSMVGHKAEKFKSRAKEVARFFGHWEWQSECYINDFVEFLKKNRKM